MDVVLRERAPSARDLTVRLPPLDDVDLGSFGVDLREHASERRGVVVVALERLPDDRQRREPRYDPEARPQGDVVERGDVGGVGDGERHLVERPAGRHNAELAGGRARDQLDDLWGDRSEEHTSELQSHSDLVCRLLLEKKKYVERTDTAHAI